MKYQGIVQAEFIERPNRFIAYVDLEGRQERVHVKNTGRCRELLTKGACVYLEKSDNPGRSTAYDLVAVRKGQRLINMDSQAPNKVVEERLRTKALFPGLKKVRPETKYGNSRFDFYIETSDSRIFMEVKGVTLEEDGVVRFPDAPSERAVKHVEELARAKKEGYRALVLFVIQMEGVKYFTPNTDTHKDFAEALIRAKEQGVEILAYDCRVTPDSLELKNPVPVVLTPEAEDSGDGSTCITENLINLKETFRLGELSDIHKPLLKWYDNNKRILPWREDASPYKVWVSEIMLQQTRVEAVKPYFERFMKALPDVKALAEAGEETLLKLWEGLGYYNRVRNLHKAAIRIMEKSGGHIPEEYEELLELEGVGSYTAGAVASIAYGKVRPAVDGNVLRVIARIRKDPRPVSDPKVRADVESDLLRIMPKDRPGDFNQALMEIGACVCIPNGMPHCGECPLVQICLAHRERCETDFPRKAPPKSRKIEEKTILVIRDAERIVIRRRPQKGLLAGMYEFPALQGFHTAEEVMAYLAERGIRTIRIQPMGEAKHIFTHREWHMKGYMVRVDELEQGTAADDINDWIYIEPQQTRDRYPIPAAFGAYADCLNLKQRQ